MCFVHLKDSGQLARKCIDIPEKIKKIHEDWAEFGQAITRFKNNIKTCRKHTYTLSIWLGSKKPTKEILAACALEWEEEQEN